MPSSLLPSHHSSIEGICCFFSIEILFHSPIDYVKQEHWCSTNRMVSTLMGAMWTNTTSKQKSRVEVSTLFQSYLFKCIFCIEYRPIDTDWMCLADSFVQSGSNYFRNSVVECLSSNFLPHAYYWLLSVFELLLLMFRCHL